MNIQSSKFNRNYLLLSKGGFKLYEFNTSEKKNPVVPNQKLTLSTNYISKNHQLVVSDKEDYRKQIKIKNNFNTCTNSTVESRISKIFPKFKEYKKRLFLKNVLSTDKNYLLEDYMKNKELRLINDHKKKNMHEARKTFFSEDKINDNRTSYFNKEKSFDKNNKFQLMIKDIQSNFILLKNKNHKKYKKYHLLKKLEAEKNNFKDFNEKLGVKNVYIKTNKIINKNRTFMNSNYNFLSCINYLNTFCSTNKTAFIQKRKNFKIK